MSAVWQHNDVMCQWELVHDEHVVSWVTDEFIARVADPAAAAAHLFHKIGSVPPPLAELLEPVPPLTVWLPR